MNISISQLRKVLVPGQKFMAEFIGKNRTVAKPENIITERVVTKQSTREMISTMVGRGVEVSNTWAGVTAEQISNNEYRLSLSLDNGEKDPYLEIILC
mgnify:CR=1 FL=1